MKNISLFLLMLIPVSSAHATENPAAGSWAVHTSIAGNEQDQKCTFAVTGKDLSGSCINDDKTTVKITGTVVENKVTWTYKSDYNGTELTITYSGTLATGKITGETSVEPFGVGGEFVATPAK